MDQLTFEIPEPWDAVPLTITEAEVDVPATACLKAMTGAVLVWFRTTVTTLDTAV